ncbi:hypothetical protein DV515_00005810, partial [Chloebia gouldiae]
MSFESGSLGVRSTRREHRIYSLAMTKASAATDGVAGVTCDCANMSKQRYLKEEVLPLCLPPQDPYLSLDRPPMTFQSHAVSMSSHMLVLATRPRRGTVSGTVGVFRGDKEQEIKEKHGQPNAWIKESQWHGHWQKGLFPGQACIGQFIKLHHIASSTAFGENWLFEWGHTSKRDISTTELACFSCRPLPKPQLWFIPSPLLLRSKPYNLSSGL